MTEGSLIVQMNGPRLKYVDFGSISGSKIYKNNIPSNDLNAGSYEMQLNFKHPQSLAFNEQFTISTESKNLTFFDVDSTISFTTCNNIVNVNEVFSIWISRTSPILPSLSSFVKCKLGNSLVPTQKVDNSNFICNVSLSQPGVEFISLWYINSDALNNEMRLSTNSLRVIFVDKITIHSVDPFTSLIGVSSISNILTTYQTDVFSGNVSYRCKFGNEFASATLQSNGIFSCSILSNNDNPRNESLILQLKSQECENWFDFSKNFVEYIFRKSVKLLTISPFSRGYTTMSQSFIFDVSFDLSSGDNVVSDKGLICKYNSTYNGYQRSKARIENNLIICQISKSTFQNQVEYLHVGLALNTSLFSTDSSYFSNLMKFVFYKSPLKYQYISIVDDSLNGNFELNLTNYETDFNYQMNFTEQLTMKSGSFPCTKGSRLECKPPVGLLETLYQPSIYNLSLVITKDKVSSTLAPETSTSLLVDSIVYFNRNNKIISAAPFVGSSITHLIQPLKIHLSLGSMLNHHQFKFFCLNSLNGEILSNATFSNPGSLNSSLSCNVKSNRKVESIPMTVSFSFNSSQYQLTSKSNIQFVDTILLNNYFGFKTGKTTFTFTYPTTSYPTPFQSNYNFTLMYNDYDVLKTINCVPNAIGICFRYLQISCNRV
jgi:hypothetical protein